MTSSGNLKEKTLPGIPPANLKELLLLFVGKRKRFKIEGHSMLPLLSPGEEVLVKPLDRLNAGDIGAFEHNGNVLIKCVEAYTEHGYNLVGLNEADSTNYNNVKKPIGLVVSKLG